MGTGKSTVGKNLAREIGFIFVDLDKEIEKNAGLTISEIFEQYGEKYFRELESKAVESLQNMKNSVVATGWGAVLDSRNLSVMKQVGLVIALDADTDALWNRLKFSKNRPKLKSADPRRSMEELYNLRRPYYAKAHHLIDTSRKSVGEVLQEILIILQK